MFKKILIANRGEIACRVIKSARKMGIATVAIYSDADRDALHVHMADEAVHVGAAPSSESYLVAERIIRACVETGAGAVHPGYGFLSENSAFCEALSKKGIAFIGPKTRAIEAMGDKITSKKLADEAGVSTIPGYTDVVTDADHAVQISRDIGYPVMLKASAGGGGKGMRVANNDDECREGFERAANEARSSFGNDRIFIEKFIVEPRHIEIQIMADGHGNVVYLNERECSLQRRHQKVIEEAPSPFLGGRTRRKMGEQAVALAKAVDYESAGTVEFIVDAKKNFYFLEMNTRLQVEHPVTELTTGIDLVEMMIRVAAGEKLPFSQRDVAIDGWAIESRVYAEDPSRNFLPSTGRLVYFRPPQESDGVRVDTGVYEGGEVSMFYDPMIAKLITYGATRDEAIARMRIALDQFVIRGVTSNMPFLSALMNHKGFCSGKMSTNTIGDEFPDGYDSSTAELTDLETMIGVVASVARHYRDRAATIHGQLRGHGRVVPAEWVIVIDGVHHPVSVVPIDGGHRVTADGVVLEVLSDWRLGQHLFSGTINGRNVYVQLGRHGQIYRLSFNGISRGVRVLKPREAELMQYIPEREEPDTSNQVLAPMPGMLLSIAVSEGDEVKVGEELAVLEAMKMENTLRAERNGTVAKIVASVGDSLEVDALILELQ